MALFGRWRRDTPQPTVTPTVVDPTKALVVQSMLAEYNSLRTESLNSISNRITIANFSFGAIAVMIAALINQSTPGLVTGVVAVVFVPQIAKTGLMVWLGEYTRSQRAGRWIAGLEKKINDTLGCECAMTWESGLIGNSTHMSYPYSAVVVLLLGAGWSSMFIGYGILFDIARVSLYWMAGLLLTLALAIVLEVLFVLFFRRQWRRIRVDYAVTTA